MRSKLGTLILLVVCGYIAAVRTYKDEKSKTIVKPIYTQISQNPSNINKYPPKPSGPMCGSGNLRKCLGDLNDTNPVVKAFMEYSIVPQIIPCPPTQQDSIIISNTEVTLGNFIPPFLLGFYPYAGNWDADPKSLYTAIYINADLNFILYDTYDLVYVNFLDVNIPGSNFIKGDVLVEYRPYLPIIGYGPQRYVSLIYEQSEKIDITLELIRSVSSSYQLNLTQFVDVNNLGDPAFGNFFVSSLSFCDSAVC